MGPYHRATVVTKERATAVAGKRELPDEVTVTLSDVAGACREGLLALAVTTGLEVMNVLLEESVAAVAGPKGRHDPRRTATRHGSEEGAVTLGGRRIPIRRPRVRTADGTGEVPIPAYELFTSRDLLGRMALERMLAGLSTRRYAVGLEPVGSAVEEVASGTSRSAVSRRFVALTRTGLQEAMSAPLDHLDPVALLLDGVGFGDHLCVVALVIDSQGRKHPVGIIEGTTENARVATDLLADLRERGLRTSGGLLVVMDGARALRRAVQNVLGKRALVQRCQEHKIRNVLSYLPKEQHSFIERKLRAAYRLADADRAQRDLESLARSLERSHPGAAGSLREGLAETLTVMRLGISPTLARTLRSTNPIESMIEICRTKSRNVKRWRDGEMALRWAAAGMVEAQKQFRRVKGHRDIPRLITALRHHSDQVGLDTNEAAA